jgi:hypothetical protein
MAMTATASKTSTRRQSDRGTARRGATRAPARRSRGATPIPGRLVPLAVGRTAGAVNGLADSGLVMRLTRGRLWIGALAALLIGIVALNVVALGLSASGSDTARSVEEMTRQGSAMRAQLAEELSDERVQGVAATLGLIVPEPGAIRYLRLSEGDAAEAARRLSSGELTAAPAPVELESAEVVPVAPVAPEVTPPAVEPAPPEIAPAPPVESPAAPPAPPAGAGSAGGGALSGGGVASP